jgi:Family of unknown function (DUF5947)
MPADVREPELFVSLRRLRRRRARVGSVCELCGAAIASDHYHLLDIKTRSVVCGCDPCAILFSGEGAGHFRRIPKDVRVFGDFVLTDAAWDALSIPINMAYFCKSSTSDAPKVFYPSPGGATESLIHIESWQDIVVKNAQLQAMEPEVEALLVNRVTKPHEYYIAPIDECYKLVGIIRTKWHGFSGGTEVWQSIGNFFTALKSRAIPVRPDPSCSN